MLVDHGGYHGALVVGAHHDAQKNDHKRRDRVQGHSVAFRSFLLARLLHVRVGCLVAGLVQLGRVPGGRVEEVPDFGRLDEHATLRRSLLVGEILEARRQSPSSSTYQPTPNEEDGDGDMFEILGRPGATRASEMLEENVRPAIEQDQGALDKLGRRLPFPAVLPRAEIPGLRRIG